MVNERGLLEHIAWWDAHYFDFETTVGSSSQTFSKHHFFVSGFSTAQLYHIHTIPPLESRGSCECWSLSATRTIHKHCKVMFIEEFVAASAGSFSFNVHFLYITLYRKAKKPNPNKTKNRQWWLRHTRTTAAAGPTKAYRSPPSKDSQQLQEMQRKKHS